MRRLTSFLLIIILVTGLGTTAVTATPPASDVVDYWMLSDGGNNIYVNMIQFPKVSMSGTESGNGGHAANSMELREIIFEMDFSLSQKYLESFKSRGTIPELVLNALNPHDRAIFKITLKNCTVCGFAVKDLFTGLSPTPVKAVIKLSAEKITSENINAAGPAVQATNAKKLDTAKLFINGTECTGFVSFSGMEGNLIRIGSAVGNVYGSPMYNDSELFIDYNAIGTLPDWLDSFDGQANYTANPKCKLKYELSSRQGDDKLTFEIQLNTIGQEFAEKEDIHKILCKYTCRVLDFSFEADDTAVVEPIPAIPTRIIIAEPKLRTTQEYNWSGSWVTTFGNMSLRQKGTAVKGEYGNPVETLEGTVSGSKLAGTWNDGLSSGKFEFTISADGKSFSGTMYNETLGDKGTFEWKGDRKE